MTTSLRKALPLLPFLLLTGLPLAAQQQNDCGASTFTFTGNANQNGVANLSQNAPCVNWRITFSTTGTLTATVTFQTSPNNSTWTSVPNTPCNGSLTPCVIQGTNPTSGSQGHMYVSAYGAFVRVIVTGAAGAGTGTIRYYGAKGATANAPPAPGLTFSAVNPIGACIVGQPDVQNTVTGAIFACIGGVWVQVAGSNGVFASALTVNRIPKATAANTLGNSSITDNGITLLTTDIIQVDTSTLAGGISINGTNNPAFNFMNSGVTKAFFGLPTANGQFSLDSISNDLVIRTNGSLNRILMNANGGAGASSLLVSDVGVQVNQPLQFATVSVGEVFKTGANARVGTGTLASGTVAVANTSITAKSFVFVQDTGGGVIANIGALYVASQTVGVGFTVTSSNILDTSTFRYWIFETN